MNCMHCSSTISALWFLHSVEVTTIRNNVWSYQLLDRVRGQYADEMYLCDECAQEYAAELKAEANDSYPEE